MRKKKKKENAVDDSRAQIMRQPRSLPNFPQNFSQNCENPILSRELQIELPKSILNENAPNQDRNQDKVSKIHEFWRGILSRYPVGNFCVLPQGILRTTSEN